jgi:hypothetical protein
MDSNMFVSQLPTFSYFCWFNSVKSNSSMFAGWNSMFVCNISFQNQNLQNLQETQLFNHGHEHVLLHMFLIVFL